MELRQLLYTVQIAQEKNFSRAAEKLHIAQPSLSQQLSKLEKEIGVLLFQRSTNSVELTHAGAVFVEKAQKILDLVDQLHKEMDDIAQMRKGRLTVGSLPITGAHILPLVLPAYRSRYPEIDVTLVEESTARLEQLTLAGQTEISLLTLPLLDATLDFEPVFEENIVLAVPPGHRLAAEVSTGREIAVEELEHEPFIVLKKGQGFRHISLELCRKAGFEPRIVFESSNIETVQSLVATGMGIAFVPSMIARAEWSRFAPTILPLAGKPSRQIVVAYKHGRYLSKAARAFIATVRDVLSPGARA
ncbi:LysR family transcriptional regulator [Paenibacillus thermoaerophilus]|uniref:LysR family transcriptional regulator n=1 Tax=Paenibacillus thermoaerophilus TaxID=1215385 RepID=A0ABW2V338_9BACL|nr:LysR family transcriptional regulator [Paenibacillus thermoaerophilus]TMV18640.1 LysR family transcriptional regulator [Paenibacillus thermoaerophilus]